VSAPRRTALALGWLLAGLLAPGAACVLDDMTSEGKGCDEAHPCPPGLACSLRPVSESTRQGACQPEDEAFACEPGELLCPASGDGWVEACETGGRSTRVAQLCAQGSHCNADTLACAGACSESEPCPAGEVCDLGTGLCRSGPACEGAACATGACVGRACVPPPAEPVSSPGGVPETGCFTALPTQPPGTPESCALVGRVSVFPLSTPEITPGLTVRLRQGRPPWEEIRTTTVTADAQGNGIYEFAAVPTNQRYLLELPAGQLGDGAPTVATLHPAVELRADGCEAGTHTRALVVLRESTFDSYTSQLLPGWDPRRGLLLGRVLDCQEPIRQALGQVTVGVSIPPAPPGRTFYFADNPGLLVPDLALGATTHKGYYAVAGLPACDNAVGFRALVGTTPLDLGSADVLVAPGGTTILDLPLPATRLPE